MDTEIEELKYLAAVDYPLWGGHLLRGEPITAPAMRRWVTEGLIQAVDKPRVGYIITDKGRDYIAQANQ